MIPASFNGPKQVRVNNDKLSVVNWFYDTEQQLLQITLRASQQNLVGRVITRTGAPIHNANVAVIVQGTKVGIDKFRQAIDEAFIMARQRNHLPTETADTDALQIAEWQNGAFNATATNRTTDRRSR